MLGLGAVVMVAGGYFLFAETPQVAVTSESNTAAVINIEAGPGEVVVTGVLDCTPLKSGEALAEGQCVMGLRGDDGRFYSLDISNMEDGREGDMTRVKAVGTYAEADNSSEEVGVYRYDGVLTVRAIESN